MRKPGGFLRLIIFNLGIRQKVFYPSMTTVRFILVFAIANPSVVLLSVVCNVRAPYSGG